MAGNDNRSVRRVVSAVVVLVLTLAVGTAAWAVCVGEQLDAHARMKCCATMHHRCGKGDADDCCNTMKDADPSSNVATPAVANVTIAPVVLDALALLPSTFLTSMASDAATSVEAAIRPHDPPHLHSFPLLI